MEKKSHNLSRWYIWDLVHWRTIVLKQSCFRHVDKSSILTNYEFYIIHSTSMPLDV